MLSIVQDAVRGDAFDIALYEMASSNILLLLLVDVDVWFQPFVRVVVHSHSRHKIGIIQS